MASFVSPGVYVIEKDLSDYPVAINPSVVGIVGFANQGPVNKATLATSQEQLLQTFGNPSESITGQGLEGGIEILETTNSLYFVRSAGTGAKDASATIPLGSCPAVEVSALGIGDTLSRYFKVQVNLDGADQYPSPKGFSVPAETVTGTSKSQATALKSVFGGGLDGSPIGSFFDPTATDKGWITAGYAGSGCVLSMSAYSDATFETAVSAFRAVDASGNVTGNALSAVSVTGVNVATTGADSLAYSVQSLYPGIGYNEGSNTDGTTSGYSFEVRKTGGINTNVQVNRDGAAEESFRVSMTASGAFAEVVINTGSTDLKSQYIKGFFTYEDADASVTALPTFYSQLSSTFTGTAINSTAGAAINPRFSKFINGSVALAGGSNGTETVPDDIVGTASDKTGIYALDDDTLNISMGIVPGITDTTVQNTLVSLAETSQNFLAVVAPPEGLATVQQAIDWSNGQSDERAVAISSNYAAIYWPWVKTFDAIAGKDRYYDPAIFAVRQMAYTDEVGEPWFAPAGVVRGRLTKPTEVEISVNQGDRDTMYSGGNVINPIVNFPQQGLMIFGQRTAQRNPTALDRVNIRRLMIIIRKQLLASTRRFVFEPNDSTTWEKVVNVVNPLLADILRRRGLTDYKVICDETTNTPVRVDRNELWCKVLLKPTKAAEIVVFELNLTNQSAEL
jgi:phage tail sheath protein FI